MSKIRITQPGWAGYTGDLGHIAFVDGVSVDHVARHTIDHLSGVVQCELIDDDGKDQGQAGVAKRLVGGATISAAAEVGLKRATDEEKAAELRSDREKAGKTEARRFYTAAELTEVGSKEGIAGLRKIAEPWGVKDRSINRLIQEIVKAQDAHLARVAALKEQQRVTAASAEEEALAAQKAREAEIDAQARILTDTTPNAVGPDGSAVYQDPNRDKPAVENPAKEADEGGEDVSVETADVTAPADKDPPANEPTADEIEGNGPGAAVKEPSESSKE